MGISGYIAGAVIVAALGYAAGQAGGKGSTVAQPDKPPQEPKTPDASSVVQGNKGMGQAGGSPGVAQTYLTGPGGVDPSLLQLGKNTLLGGAGGASSTPGG